MHRQLDTQVSQPSPDLCRTISSSLLIVTAAPNSPDDPRIGAELFPKQYRPVLRDGVEPLARGTWSTPEEDPSAMSGFRRYGASKLCVILMM